MRAGIAFRSELAPWLASRPGEVRCLELSVDTALSASLTFRARQIRRWPTALHAPQLAVGTPDAIPPAEIDRVLHAVRAVDPIWIGGYLGGRYRPETELSYPQPVSLTRAALSRAVTACGRLVDAGVRPLLVENVAAFGIVDEDLSPADFVNKLCDESGCGLLLDVTTLTLDARLGFDPRRWLWDIDPSHVVAIRLRSTVRRAAETLVWSDDPLISDATWSLAREISDRTSAETAILQCRGECPAIAELQTELHLVAAIDRLSLPLESLPEVPARATR